MAILLGLSAWLRHELGYDRYVNKCSIYYQVGDIVGTGAILIALDGVGSEAEEAGNLPDKVFDSKAPTQVEPGVRSLNGQHINDLGKVEPWEAHYDEYGRIVGRTDYAGNATQGIPNPHYHTFEYGPGFSPYSQIKHIPGVFPLP